MRKSVENYKEQCAYLSLRTIYLMERILQIFIAELWDTSGL